MPNTIDVKDASGVTVTLKTIDNLICGVSYTDRSGTVTSGGVAQQIAASNASRRGFFIQNQSTGDLWLSTVGTAAATQPSVWLPAGAYYEFPCNGVSTGAVSLFGATTGQAFAAREW